MSIQTGRSIIAPGVSPIATGSDQVVALPVTASGALPKIVRIQAGGFGFFRLGVDASIIATFNDTMMTPNDTFYVCSAGFTHLGFLSNGATFPVSIDAVEA